MPRLLLRSYGNIRVASLPDRSICWDLIFTRHDSHRSHEMILFILMRARRGESEQFRAFSRSNPDPDQISSDQIGSQAVSAIQFQTDPHPSHIVCFSGIFTHRILDHKTIRNYTNNTCVSMFQLNTICSYV